MGAHKRHVCTDDHDGRHCVYCDGGLYLCDTCGGAEGSLPSECPERAMTNTEQDAVYSGTLDFVGGEWVAK